MHLTLPDCISMTSDLVVGLAALVTAVAAVWGLWKWRSELAGKAKFDAARNLAKATYGVRNAVERARSRLIDDREFPAGFHEGPSVSPIDKARAYEQVFARRWEPIWAALDGFDAASLEAEVFWGKELRDTTYAMRKALRELQVAADAFVANEANAGEDFEHDRELGKRMRSTLFASPSETGNAFSRQLEDAVKRIEDQLRPHLLRE